MKKILLVFLSALGLAAQGVNAQTATFSTQSDTVKFSYNTGTGGDQLVTDYVSTPTTHDSVVLNWDVTGTDFPSDWDGANLGICDNHNCYLNDKGALWNGTSGTVYTSDKYAGTGGDFHMQIRLSSASAGTHWMSATLTDPTSGYSKKVVFLVSKSATSVSTVNKQDDHISLYPNPASNEVNVVYDPSDNVKTIAVFNLIGKAMTVYKPINNSSARLNIDNIPSGIYFVRLMDAQGSVVATRKFTRQ